MTIDEHLNAIMSKLPFTNNGTDYRIRGELKTALLEIAREQRHACERAIEDLEISGHDVNKAYQAVRNATLD